MHQPYENILGHHADFRVAYRYYEQEEGGRRTLPFQGIRSDFWYDSGDHTLKGVFMIWPEFEDASGEVILENNKSVQSSGTARMWIINNQLRKYHQERIKIGLTGYFIEGKRVATCEIIEIIGLLANPI